jgi:hypothetical protein
MKLISSWETASCAATKIFPNILWNPKVHWRVHKSPPLVSIPSQINSIHITPSYPAKIHCNIREAVVTPQWILARYDGVMWIELIWLGIETSGGLLWTRQWTFGFHKMFWNILVASQLAVSQEGISSIELVFAGIWYWSYPEPNESGLYFLTLFF